MISPRKRRIMLRNLNHFFVKQGSFISEVEYRKSVGTPYRLDQIQRYLGGWVRMRAALFRYYPKWREQYEAELAAKKPAPVKEKPVITENDPLEAMRAKAKAAKESKDEDE